MTTKKLSELFQTKDDTIITGISQDSRTLRPGDIFVCTIGLTTDRHDYVDKAIDAGAAAIVASHPVSSSVPVILVEDTNKALSEIAAKFFDYPAERLKLIGVTGTDGKTSTSTVIAELLRPIENCGYIGTNGANATGFEGESPNTTPPPEILEELLNDFVEHGCTTAAMEVSSEGLYYGRVDDVLFDVAVLTNITGDHMNVHKTMEEYIEVKSKLLSLLKPNGIAILNRDDEYFSLFAPRCHSYITYGIDLEAEYMAKDIEESLTGTKFTLVAPDGEYTIESPLLFKFNVYNLLAALAALHCLGHNISDLIKNLQGIYVDGRLNFIDLGQNYTALVDYAHTVNGIHSMLSSLRPLTEGKIVTVLGSAGERDRQKRGHMGLEAALSDHIIFTSEDPRDELPIGIMTKMAGSLDKKKYELISNRYGAIKRGVEMVGEGDLLLVLGKGNEDYQLIHGEKVYFNDIIATTACIMERQYTEKLKAFEEE